jgi:hypothetical protein
MVNLQDQWGPGDEFQAFDTAVVGTTVVELGWGEHPHSRSDNRMYVRFPSGRVEGFDGHRIQVSISLCTSNYLKDSELSGAEVRKSCECIIYLNGVVARRLDGRDPSALLLAAHHALGELLEMSCSIWRDGESLVGRKIYFRGDPAVIDHITDDELFIVPEEGMFTAPPHASRDSVSVNEWLDDYGRGLRVADNSPDIWWWRDE